MAPRENREEREKRILDVAKKMITENGFLSLKMGELAKQASISIGTLYVHFPSKEDLLIGVAMISKERRERAFVTILENREWSPDTKLSAIVFADQILSNKDKAMREVEALCLLPSIWKKASELSYHKLEKSGSELAAKIESVVADGLEAKVFHPSPADDGNIGIALMFWSMSLGLQTALDSYCSETVEAMKQNDRLSLTLKAVDTLARGLAPEPSPNPNDLNELYSTVENLISEMFT